MRKSLSVGSVLELTLNGVLVSYCIEKVIGEGANCIAYEARRVGDSAYRCRIKECYPHDAGIRRVDQTLIWEDENERNEAFAKLRRTQDLIVELRNADDIGNHITTAEIGEGNGTLYSMMEINYASTFDHIANLSLHQILDTVCVLTEIVGRLHAQGYLHLDIKPTNFLATHKPNTNIWLFDVDSLTSIKELKENKVYATSYSPRWAAPEQRCGKADKLCPATDIFAIGAVLFESVMGRPVSNDDMGLFAEWDFKGELFESVNPKVKRHLCTIFKRTLSASVKRRYQSAEELAEALKKAWNVTIDGKPFLKSNCPSGSTYFVGRELELKNIREEFKQGKRIVFLHGVGGIGKSTTAIAYGNLVREQYDAVIFARYRDSMDDLFDGIEIHNYDDDSGNRRKTLKRLLDRHALLIIDNFDVAIDEVEDFEDLLGLKSDILITSRTDFSGVYTDSVKQIEMDSLPYPELECIFVRYSGYMPQDENERNRLKRLLESVGNHTLATEILGRQMMVSGYTLQQLCEKTTFGFSALEDTEKVRVQKDGHVLKCTGYEVIKKLFDVASVTEEQKQALRNMYLLQFVYVNQDVYRSLTGADARGIDALNDLTEMGWIQTVKQDVYRSLTGADARGIDALNNLTEMGWIQTNEYHTRYTLQPLIAELIQNELKPCAENCDGVFQKIHELIKACIEYDGYGAADEHQQEYRQKLLGAFFSWVSLKNLQNRKLAIDWLLGMIFGENTEIDAYGYGSCTGVYKSLQRLDKGGFLTPMEKYQTRFILLCALLRELGFSFSESKEERNARYQAGVLRLRQLYEELKCIVNELTDELPENLTLPFVAAEISSLWHLKHDLPAEFIVELFAEYPEAFNWSPEDKRRSGLPLTDAEKEALIQEEKKKEEREPEDWEIRAALSREYVRAYQNSPDKLGFITAIIADPDRQPGEKAYLVSECIDSVLGRLSWFPERRPNLRIDWAVMEEMLDIEEDYLLGDEWVRDSIDEVMEWSGLMDKNSVNQAIVYAATGNEVCFDIEMEGILEDIGNEIQGYLKRNLHWSHIASRYLTSGKTLHMLRNALIGIGKCSMFFPYLMRYVNGWEEYARKQDDFEETYLVELYQRVVDTAQEIYCEEGVQEELREKIRYIKYDYQKRINKATGTTLKTRYKCMDE